MRARRLLAIACLLAVALAAPVALPARGTAAARSAYFPQTGHNVAEPFLRFFQANGAVPLFGLPLTEAFADGGLTIQYFERARLESHPDFPAGQQIAVGQLGRELAAARAGEAPFRSLPAPTGVGTFFPQTGHTLRGGFASYWQGGGGLPIFGYPLSEEFTEDLPGAGPTTVQYFERARLELRAAAPGGAPGVTLGLLGTPSFAARGHDPALLARVAAAPAPAPRPLTIPVLEYHDVGFGVGTYQVTLAAFTQQLDWLRANGYQTVGLDDLFSYVYEGGELPAKPVVLTFDDGRASQVNAVRELNARGMKGVFFILGGANALPEAQIRALLAAGHEIESHTMSHPQLSRLSDAQLAYELAASKRALEAKYGVPIRYLAYPYGDYNARVMAATAAAGYEGALAAWGGGSWTPEKRYQQPRIIVTGTASLNEFIALVRGATAR